MDYIRSELSPQRITGSSVTVVKTGRAFLGNIRLNAPSGAITIFDGIAGGAQASAIGIIASGTLVLSHDFGWVMAGGITITTPNANSDFTVASANN